MPFYPFLGEGSPTKIDYRKKLVPLFNSKLKLLEELVEFGPTKTPKLLKRVKFCRRHRGFPRGGIFQWDQKKRGLVSDKVFLVQVNGHGASPALGWHYLAPSGSLALFFCFFFLFLLFVVVVCFFCLVGGILKFSCWPRSSQPNSL